MGSSFWNIILGIDQNKNNVFYDVSSRKIQFNNLAINLGH